MPVTPFRWRSNRLEILDQRLLPHKIKNIVCRRPAEVADAIRGMAVRGAPAIGCCAAYGMALAAAGSRFNLKSFLKSAAVLKAARPTAVNLAWAVDRMVAFAAGSPSFKDLVEEAHRITSEDLAMNIAMSKHGAALFSKDSVILTHCNTGALATAGVGTALGVIREAFKQGKVTKVFVDETRPYLQGARLTAWELSQEKIPHELITDSMAAHFMRTERVDGVIVGCDRVAANGDTANKIGTYGLAVHAAHHKIPFYVAMPTSTLDLSIPSGDHIPIEDRSSDEVVRIAGIRIAPKRTKARHPAFDVTSGSLITAIICEHGVVRPPYLQNLAALKNNGLFQDR